MTKSYLFYIAFILLSLFFFFNKHNVFSQPYCEGDSITLNALDYVAGELQWQYSYNGDSWFDYSEATSLSHVIYPVESIFVRLQITDPMCLPAYYSDVEYIELVPLPTTAFAGEDMIDLDTNSVYLNGNVYNTETELGQWSVISGEGGSFSDENNPSAEFSGEYNEEYVLEWEIFNQCGSSSDNVTISFGPPPQFQCGDILIDSRDNQTYATVEIGNQCWMAENLNIGEMIQGTENQSDPAIIQKYCYENDPTNCDIYGGLYQWDQVMNYVTEEGSQGICPEGWIVPSDGDIIEMEMYLGMSETDANLTGTFRGHGIGTELMEGGSTGFDVLMSGARNTGGGWQFIEGSTIEFGYLYTSTDNGDNAYRRCFRSDNTGVGRYNNWPKEFGLSLRCIKE